MLKRSLQIPVWLRSAAVALVSTWVSSAADCVLWALPCSGQAASLCLCPPQPHCSSRPFAIRAVKHLWVVTCSRWPGGVSEEKVPDFGGRVGQWGVCTPGRQAASPQCEQVEFHTAVQRENLLNTFSCLRRCLMSLLRQSKDMGFQILS